MANEDLKVITKAKQLAKHTLIVTSNCRHILEIHEMQKINDLTGKRFGRLTVLYPTPNRYQGKVIWVCKCDCGTTKNIIGANLMNGSTVSCGCKSKQVLRESREKHGKSNTRIYNIYICMKERCYNPNSPSYKNYGGRGIEVCEEWANNFEAFYEWSIENGYQDSLTID